MVPAVVLTAGLATRLRPLSLVRAKGALPLAGRPIVVRILERLRDAGVAEAVLNLHHLPHTLTALVGDGSSLGLRVRYSWETPILGSAGGPARAALLLGVPRFLVVNGDTLTDADLGALVDAHRSSGALVTMAVVDNTAPQKYGGVLADREGAVTGFSRPGSSGPSWHFTGVQVVEAEAFAPVPPDVPFDSVGALYPALLASRPGSVRVYRTGTECLDVGTPADYLDASLLLSRRERRDATAHASIGASARVERSVLWNDVVVEAGAVLRECVVTDGVRVPADTSWHGVTIRPATGELTPQERRIDGLAIGPLEACHS